MKRRKDDSNRPPRSLTRAFLLRAVALTVLFSLAHLMGLREYTSVISGTATFGYLKRFGGVIYIAFYALFVTCVPILLIAAAMAKITEIWGKRRSAA